MAYYSYDTLTNRGATGGARTEPTVLSTFSTPLQQLTNRRPLATCPGGSASPDTSSQTCLRSGQCGRDACLCSDRRSRSHSRSPSPSCSHSCSRSCSRSRSHSRSRYCRCGDNHHSRRHRRRCRSSSSDSRDDSAHRSKSHHEQTNRSSAHAEAEYSKSRESQDRGRSAGVVRIIRHPVPTVGHSSEAVTSHSIQPPGDVEYTPPTSVDIYRTSGHSTTGTYGTHNNVHNANHSNAVGGEGDPMGRHGQHQYPGMFSLSQSNVPVITTHRADPILFDTGNGSSREIRDMNNMIPAHISATSTRPVSRPLSSGVSRQQDVSMYPMSTVSDAFEQVSIPYRRPIFPKESTPTHSSSLSTSSSSSVAMRRLASSAPIPPSLQPVISRLPSNHASQQPQIDDHVNDTDEQNSVSKWWKIAALISTGVILGMLLQRALQGKNNKSKKE